jgi:hypothetical protein
MWKALSIVFPALLLAWIILFVTDNLASGLLILVVAAPLLFMGVLDFIVSGRPRDSRSILSLLTLGFILTVTALLAVDVGERSRPYLWLVTCVAVGLLGAWTFAWAAYRIQRRK